MDKDISDSVKAAYLEFKEEPMDDYYSNKIAGFFSRLRVKKILKEIKGKSEILDVGCEAGYVSIQMAKTGAKITAIDICEPALEKFREKIKGKNSNIKILSSFAQNLPFKDKTFDCVVCTEAIEHMPQLDKVFAEMSRVLKKEGKLIITFPNESIRKKVYWIVKLFGINADVEKDVTLFNLNPKNIIKMLQTNFEITKSKSLPLYLPLTRIIVGKKR